jgi:hypothetical protein
MQIARLNSEQTFTPHSALTYTHVDAFRSLSYSTYFAADDGRIACCGLDYDASTNNASTYWFDDGYGDYLRNIMWALGAIPTLAPQHQDHLLRSSSVVQTVQYGKRSIQYRTLILPRLR